MDRWYKLGQSAAKAALKFRVTKELGFDEPCDIYQVVADEKIDLQFVDIPSLEGMFLQEPEATRICVCAQRPWGRQRYTTAHELAHCILGHGTQVDMAIDARAGQATLSDEEILAEAFARFILMPPRAVVKAFDKRPTSDPQEILKVSCLLGVGYGTLVRQMCSTLKLISNMEQERLLRIERRDLCRKIAGIPELKEDVWPLDERWRNRRIHVQLGDVIQGINARGSCLLASITGNANRVEKVGTETVPLVTGGSVTISSSQRAFVGFYDYRYLPE